jgi:hypothetical protein
MANNIFTLENIDNFTEKINMDDLYERKKQNDLQKLDLFKKILNRIHVRIKTISRQKIDEQFCWFVVPEIIIGVPKYDQGNCIAFLLDRLKENGFAVRYIHPNALFISWHHWVPSYVRNELKKKTGLVMDEYGNIVPPEQQDEDENGFLNMNMNNMNMNNMNMNMNNMNMNNMNMNQESMKNVNKKQFVSIDQYKPSGQFIYNEDLLKEIEDKTNGAKR